MVSESQRHEYFAMISFLGDPGYFFVVFIPYFLGSFLTLSTFLIFPLGASKKLVATFGVALLVFPLIPLTDSVAVILAEECANIYGFIDLLHWPIGGLAGVILPLVITTLSNYILMAAALYCCGAAINLLGTKELGTS